MWMEVLAALLHLRLAPMVKREMRMHIGFAPPGVGDDRAGDDQWCAGDDRWHAGDDLRCAGHSGWRIGDE